ncbi:hypothetical protein QC761_0050970 [Podospora bellae-mahoneyi]|uniref:Uncharacterized protein n=1 Tax=Podospora bellae-mahoneyi TaxID=2093777 RepID=A0ABR0FMK7_9PEZI|nr:hypothetical protein QC761_0050970 [Podospora bellae-mahoneyi]
MLIGRLQARIGGTESFPAPVNGLTDDLISTSGDVHLYANPDTHYEKHPVLLADYEGLGGGQNVPGAKEHQSSGKVCTAKVPAKDRMGQRLQNLLQSVCCEVTFQSDVLVNLVEWAYSSIEKAVDQPVLPHLIITLSRTDNAINEEQWDPRTAADMLLAAHQDITQVPELIRIVRGLKLSGHSVKSAKELLECFYQSITVVRIPTKGRYMQIDQQIGKLYNTIRQGHEFVHREEIRTYGA